MSTLFSSHAATMHAEGSRGSMARRIARVWGPQPYVAAARRGGPISRSARPPQVEAPAVPRLPPRPIRPPAPLQWFGSGGGVGFNPIALDLGRAGAEEPRRKSSGHGMGSGCGPLRLGLEILLSFFRCLIWVILLLFFSCNESMYVSPKWLKSCGSAQITGTVYINL